MSRPPTTPVATHCPKCQGQAARAWLQQRQADLLPVPYYHIAFTLPAPVAAVAFQNKALVYDLLFRTAADTLLTIAADPQQLGARIGLTAVMHTWGSAMTHHPYVHIVVPGGGLSPDGSRWIACRPSFLLPVRVLFRRLFLDRLAEAHRAGRLAFHSAKAPKVGVATAPPERRFSSRGSSPSARSLRAASRLRRASANDTALMPPWPISRCFPSTVR